MPKKFNKTFNIESFRCLALNVLVPEKGNVEFEIGFQKQNASTFLALPIKFKCIFFIKQLENDLPSGTGNNSILYPV